MPHSCPSSSILDEDRWVKFCMINWSLRILGWWQLMGGSGCEAVGLIIGGDRWAAQATPAPICIDTTYIFIYLRVLHSRAHLDA